MNEDISGFCIKKDGLYRKKFMGDHYCGFDPNPVCIYRTKIRAMCDIDGRKQGCIYLREGEVPASENPMAVTLIEILRRLRQQDF